MNPVRTVSGPGNLLAQAIFKLEEFSLCAQEDLVDDERYDHSSEFEAMAKSLRVLFQELQGRGEFSDRERSQIMPQVNHSGLIFPFFPLIAAIDSACRQGIREI